MHVTQRVTSGRAALAVFSTGQGPPVVMLHANVCDSRMWHDQMSALGGKYEAVSYDRRGFGETTAEPEDFSSVADLMSVLDATSGDRPAVLIGCSQGGKIAIDAALSHPTRVRALVLISPSVGGAPEAVHPPAIREMLDMHGAAENAGDLRQLNSTKARLWLDGPLAEEGRGTPRARRLILEMNGIALRSAPVGSNVDTAPAFCRVNELEMPSLIIWGDLDFPHIQERSRYLASAIPQAAACVLNGSAHLPSLDAPAALTTALIRFLDGLAF